MGQVLSPRISGGSQAAGPTYACHRRQSDTGTSYLCTGSFDHHADPTQFKIHHLTDEQYAELVDLVESYFLAGYEYFRPVALKVEDQSRLECQFDG